MDNTRGSRGERGSDDYGYSYRSGGQGGRERYGPRGETRYGGYEGGRGAQDRDRDGRDNDDRGFFERAGAEVRSWFSDDDDTRGRDRYEKDDDRGGYRTYGDRAFGNTERHDYDRSRQSAGQGGRGQRQSGGNQDVHGYADWRQRQIEQLDRDYDEYRREHQSQFDSHFASWREKRTTQRGSLGKVAEHQEVVGSDGQHIGTVDKVKGDRIILTKNDQDAGGRHHSIPCAWIESVDDKVTVNKTHDEAQRLWKDEEGRNAMFGEDGQQDQPTTGNYARSSTSNW